MSKDSPLFAERLASIMRETMEKEGIKIPKKKRKPKEEDPEVYTTDGNKVYKLDKKKKPKLVWSKKKGGK